MRKHIWAIGLKNYIQIRAASKPPRKVVTEATTIVKELETNTDLFSGCQCPFCQGQRGVKQVSKPFKIVITHYVGGKILCTLPKCKFGLLLAEGCMCQLPNNLIKLALELGGICCAPYIDT